MRMLILVAAIALTVPAQPVLFTRPVAAHPDTGWGWPSWSAITARIVVINGPVTFPLGHLIADVRAGSPAGVPTTAGLPVSGPPLILATGATSTEGWGIPAGTAAGTYWLRINYTDAAGINYDEYVAGRVFDPNGGAFLQRTTNPTLGGTGVFTIDDTTATAPGAPYVAAASLTSNTGIPVFGETLAVDPDVLFFLSWPNPIPELSGFIGILDAMGRSTLQMQIPNVPELAGVPVRLQAVILDVVTGARVTSPSGYVLP